MQHRPWKKTKYQPTTLIAVVVLLTILFSLVGYYFVLPDLERSQQADRLLADLALQEERWRTTKPNGYRYIVERECYCPGENTEPYTVAALDGVLLEPLAPGAIRVDDLFLIARNALAAAYKVDVSFSARFGYPSRVAIDDLEGGRASIETYRIRDFEVTDYGRPDGSD